MHEPGPSYWFGTNCWFPVVWSFFFFFSFFIVCPPICFVSDHGNAPTDLINTYAYKHAECADTAIINIWLPFEDSIFRKRIKQNKMKGALDKRNIYLFLSSSDRGFKIKPIPKISADSANAFSFYEVFCEQHHLQSAP